MAVERLKRCENIVALSEELGVRRRLLYKWRIKRTRYAGDERRRRTRAKPRSAKRSAS